MEREVVDTMLFFTWDSKSFLCVSDDVSRCMWHDCLRRSVAYSEAL